MPIGSAVGSGISGGFGFGARGAARSQRKARSKDIARVRQAFSPEDFMARFNTLFPAFQKSFEPQRVRAADAARLGENTMLNAADKDFSRRGLAGSGAHFGARQGARATGQAMTNNAFVQLLIQALQGAIGQAGRQQQGIGGALGGAITPGAFAPSLLSSVGDNATSTLSAYLAS